MIRTGCVVSLTDNIAKVQLDPLDCQRCESGNGCAITLLPTVKRVNQASAILDCEIDTAADSSNSTEIRSGDRVEISLKISTVDKVRLYGVYLLPVIGLLAGAIGGTLLAGYILPDSQLLPSLGAVVGFTGGLFAYPSYNCQQRATDLRGLNPRISRRLNGESTIAFKTTTSADG